MSVKVPVIEMTDEGIQKEAEKQEAAGDREQAKELRKFRSVRQLVAAYLKRDLDSARIEKLIDAWGPTPEWTRKWLPEMQGEGKGRS